MGGPASRQKPFSSQPRMAVALKEEGWNPAGSMTLLINAARYLQMLSEMLAS